MSLSLETPQITPDLPAPKASTSANASTSAGVSETTPPEKKPIGLDRDGVPTLGIELSPVGLTAEIKAPGLPAVSSDGTRVAIIFDPHKTEGADDWHLVVLDTEKDRTERDTQLVSPVEGELVASEKLPLAVVQARIVGRIRAARASLAGRSWQPMSRCEIALPDSLKLDDNEPQKCTTGELDVHYQRPHLKLTRRAATPGASAATLIDQDVPAWAVRSPLPGCSFHAVVETLWLDPTHGVLFASVLNAYATPDGCRAPRIVHVLRFKP